MNIDDVVAILAEMAAHEEFYSIEDVAVKQGRKASYAESFAVT